MSRVQDVILKVEAGYLFISQTGVEGRFYVKMCDRVPEDEDRYDCMIYEFHRAEGIIAAELGDPRDAGTRQQARMLLDMVTRPIEE